MIFYLSGTGNTKWAATTIAQATGEELINILDIRDEGTPWRLKENERIGFCFPVHGWRPPVVMREFIKKLDISEPSGHYVFALCTAGDNIGEAIDILRDDLSSIGIHLDSAFSLIMPESYVGLPFMDVDTPVKEKKKKEKAAEDIKIAIKSITNDEKGVNVEVNGVAAYIKKADLSKDKAQQNPENYNDGDIYIAGALEEDINGMQSVCRQCFPEGDRDLQTPSEDAQGLVLKDKGKVVGYVVWSEKEHSVYDMAVLPEYRKDKNSSSFKLLNETVKRLKKIGGEWTAELRDNTSLRYMKAMEGRGLVNLEVGEIDHTMSDGSKVYQVKFSAKDDAPQNQNVGNSINPNFNGGNGR